MSDSHMQPEKEARPQHREKGEDVTAMSTDVSFLIGGTTSVSVQVTGTGTDTSDFNLYGGSGKGSPGPSNGAHLEGPVPNRPQAMAGDGTWTSAEQYNISVTYVRAGTTVVWGVSIPATSLRGNGPYDFDNLSLTRQVG